MSKGDARERKAEYFAKFNQLVNDYPKIILVTADNVGSNQMHKIRLSLRGEAIILMGKNTMIRRAIRQQISTNPGLEKVLPHIRGNVGFVFTKGDLREVRTKLLSQRVAAPAKTGAVAPIDVFVDAQNTGMGPEKTSFFQALGIATKITKGTIEIINKVHLIKKDEKVGHSEAALLNMLNISPFTYGLQVSQVYENGAIFGNDILDIEDSQLLDALVAGVRNVACISLAVGYPTVASVPHSIINSFKNLVALALVTDYIFPAAAKIKDILSDPAKMAAAAAAAAASSAPAKVEAKAEAAPAKKEEVKKEESDEDMGFGLFD